MKTPMRSIFAALALVAAAAAPAFAAEPSPDPTGLPIRNVTVDVQRGASQDAAPGASHIERPPFASPRRFRVMEAAPAAAPHPLPTPTPTPAGRR